MLTGSRRGARVVAASLFLLATAAAAAAQTITTPKQHFGFNIGDDYQLATYTQFVDYWQKLDKESDRMKVVEIGKTAEGRPQLMAIITSPENHKKLDRYKEISRRLALAEGLTDEQARALAKEGKGVVWFDGGLHATEVLGAHQLIETVYQLVSRTDAETTRFLNDLVILAVHANPDGMELVSSWYMREPDPTRRSTAGLPRLYQKYIGHDNNRDFYMSTQPESTNMNRAMYIEWFPQIMYNHHQTGPAGTVMFAPPFRDPFNYNFDPLIPAQLDLVAAAMHSRFAAEGKPGVTSKKGSSYSTWWNGGLRTMAYFHNMIGLLTETIGNPTPTSIPFIPSKQLPDSNLHFPIEPQVWHFRQSIDYSVTANYAVFDIASRNRENFLYNIYQMGKNSIERGNRDSWTPTPRRVIAAETRQRRSRPGCGDAPGGDEPDAGGGRGGRGGSPEDFKKLLRDPGDARSARLHPAVGSAGLSDRDEVRQRAAQDRHHGAPGDGAVHRRGQELSGRLVRRENRSGVPAARARHVRAAGSSRRHPVSRRPADAAVRQRRLDARVSDGRQVRPRPRRLRRPVREAERPAETGARQGDGDARRLAIRSATPSTIRLRRSTGCSRPARTCRG